ncbi:tyrosine-type recombinase/integrase [Candidatus Vondammii sp. HM_W22]|uniref:tyrosine-type recombinase/integrase n=1 Tax=Candidatus Vondammii sp. HM_W22 TaxID=2687299 RepID=UPI001F12CC77|nr:site-specific integrase [Candidatus Vondammii sp. HM_W22]
MASIRKRGKKWLAEVRLKSGYTAKSFDSKLEAQAWAVSQEQEMGRNAGLVRGKTLADAFLRYAGEVSPTKTKKGQRWELIRLNKLCRADFASVLLTDLRTEDINQWKDSELKRIKSSSVNRELNLIASVIEIARKQWKWIENNPVRDVDRPKNPSPRDRRISELEIERILDALGYTDTDKVVTQRQEIAVAFLFALETAMRQGEIWGLDWCNVDLKNRFVTLPETKNGSKRDVPLSLRAVSLLEKLPPKSKGRVFQYNQQSSGTIFRRALKLAEVDSLTFHDTRHEALTRLARKLDVLDLARMVGHRDPRSLMIYYNATASEIAQRLD